MPIIDARGLGKLYGRRVGVQRVDLAVPEGTIYGFLGPNGAGKTTTIRLLLGFLRPSTGSARILDLDCWRQSHRIKRDVGYLPGDLRLYAWMNARSAVKVIGQVRGCDLAGAGRDLADRFQLDMTVRVRKMSRGMRQKLGLILALAHAPRLLILDEPTTGLDPLMQIELMECLRQLAARGHTVFFSSHTLSEVEALCQRVAIVRDGRIVADETLDDLRSRARREVTLEFQSAEEASGLEPPACLDLLHRDGARWRGELSGEARPLLEWIAGRPVRDILIGPPDLDTIFRRFYRTGREDR